VGVARDSRNFSGRPHVYYEYDVRKVHQQSVRTTTQRKCMANIERLITNGKAVTHLLTL